MTGTLLRLLLRILGGICVLAVIPMFMPRSWLEAGHQFVGLGQFPTAPIAEYLARSVSALCGFYGGLLLVLSSDVHRFVRIIKYQAIAIMLLSALGIFAGVRAGIPALFVVADALGCWVFLLPILICAARLHPKDIVFAQDRFDGAARGISERIERRGAPRTPQADHVEDIGVDFAHGG